MQTVDDKTVISGLRLYASNQYGLLITVGGVGGVGGDFSQTARLPGNPTAWHKWHKFISPIYIDEVLNSLHCRSKTLNRAFVSFTLF